MDNNFKRFRALDARQRRDAIRADLSGEPYRIDFRCDVCRLSHSQRCALADMAKAVGYRKPVTSMHTVGGAFFVHLSKDLSRGEASAVKTGAGMRWDNHDIARG